MIHAFHEVMGLGLGYPGFRIHIPIMVHIGGAQNQHPFPGKEKDRPLVLGMHKADDPVQGNGALGKKKMAAPQGPDMESLHGRRVQGLCKGARGIDQDRSFDVKLCSAVLIPDQNRCQNRRSPGYHVFIAQTPT